MNKTAVIEKIIGSPMLPKKDKAKAFAPSNIALCKYWGKRDPVLNLPMTGSLSVSLNPKGSETQINIQDAKEDTIIVDGEKIKNDTTFGKNLIHYLDLFRAPTSPRLTITTCNNIPVAAGFASSASGFGALTKALNQLYDWQLPQKQLSILARLGSGSACRSLWNGFVEWHQGSDPLGMDSHGEPLKTTWPQLCIGIVTISSQKKPYSSREAMAQTLETSTLYQAWPKQVEQDLKAIKKAIHEKNFLELGRHSEQNANAMHATLMASWPSISYHLPQTIEIIQKIWAIRKKGLDVYYTQDAGPNIKLLFLEKDKKTVAENFSCSDIIQPFSTNY